MVPVCRDCTVLDHKEQGNQAHVIVDVSAALNDNAEEFNNVENRSKQLLQSMKTRSDALANSSKQLDLLERILRQKIKDTFIEYRLLLERRQEGQIAILHDMIKNQKGLINTRFVEVCTQGSKLQKLYDSFTKARPTNDITKIFKVHNEMKEHEQQFAAQAETNDDELFVGCEFEVTNEPLFLSEMSCLGEVTQKPDLELKKPVPAHKLLVIDREDRRIQAEAQMPDPSQLDCDDLMVEQARSRERILAERADRLARLRARINHREHGAEGGRRRDIDQDDDETEDMEEDPNEMITSSYLLRIASRLNESSANLSEAILDLSTERDQSPDDMPSSTSSSTSHGGSGSRRQGNGPSPPRSRRSSANVRVVRHPPNVRTPPDRSDRYISTRYDRRGNEQQ